MPQNEDGVERPIQYVSALFTGEQKKLATIVKEAYSVMYCLKKLWAYLLGSEFVVYTDHKPLLSHFTIHVYKCVFAFTINEEVASFKAGQNELVKIF